MTSTVSKLVPLTHQSGSLNLLIFVVPTVKNGLKTLKQLWHKRLQIQQAYETQDIWKDFELEAVATYAEKTLHLSQQANQELQQEMRNEAQQANIQFVPTIILGEHIFDESIDQASLANYLNE